MYLEQFWETQIWRHINHKSLQLYNWLRNPTHLANPLYMRYISLRQKVKKACMVTI